ncbi:MAG: Ribonuclease 3 [Promethearchaeota archaeon]|nr:MAG: Ribonuclease 3 [Candidatus Lokiarchaeota archaeon]
MIDKNKLSILQKNIEYSFRNEDLLLQAVTTPRFAHERGMNDYEILETIGDAVIKLIFVMKKYKSGIISPGKITKLKQQLENDNMLKKIARKYFHLELYINKADTQEIKGTKILADVFEALCGAIFIDSNEDLQVVEEKIINRFYEEWDILVEGTSIFNKSKLLEFLQSQLKYTPIIKCEYEPIGPDNKREWIAKNPKLYDNKNQLLKSITSLICSLTSSQSKTKKEAEQKLYYQILKILEKRNL